MAGLFPEGTPHLDLRDPDRAKVIVAGPNPRQRRADPASTTSPDAVADAGDARPLDEAAPAHG